MYIYVLSNEPQQKCNTSPYHTTSVLGMALNHLMVKLKP